MSYLDDIAQTIRQEIESVDLPSEPTRDLFLIYAVLLLAKGELVSNQDVHNAWVSWMEIRGEAHDSMIPFSELPSSTQAEDSPFSVAIRKAAKRLELHSEQ
jgi:hypothetical protein